MLAVVRPPLLLRSPLSPLCLRRSLCRTTATARTASTRRQKEAAKHDWLKRRTRSAVEVDMDVLRRYGDPSNSSHVPVLLCEVLHAFQSLHLGSFVDCTLGAAGHSSAMIDAHAEMELYVGMDLDPTTHDMARTRIDSLLADNKRSNLNAYTRVTNFKNIKHILDETTNSLRSDGVDGILIDLGMSSMQVDSCNRGFSVLQDGPLDMRMDPQADLKAEDILNSWPESEIGRILRDYGEESNWKRLQQQIVEARANGALHSTKQLVKIVRKNTKISSGRQGWIKTATRVFQALRIAVNNELENLENALYSSFDCLAPGGRLAVISFHSLEDRIVKQTFLRLINHLDRDRDDDHDGGDGGDGDGDGESGENEIEIEDEGYKNRVHGRYGTILTKRPITPSVEEEKLNPRSRSAKLRIIHKSSA